MGELRDERVDKWTCSSANGEVHGWERGRGQLTARFRRADSKCSGPHARRDVRRARSRREYLLAAELGEAVRLVRQACAALADRQSARRVGLRPGRRVRVADGKGGAREDDARGARPASSRGRDRASSITCLSPYKMSLCVRG